MIALVDMNTEKVIEVIDSGVRPLPPPSQELDQKSTGVRTAPKPLVLRTVASKTLDTDAKPETQQKNLAKAVTKMLKNYPPVEKK